MLALQWLTISIAFFSVFYKASPTPIQGSPSASGQKRYLLNNAYNGNVPFCSGICGLTCPLGYQSSPIGCYLCACVVIASGQLQTPSLSASNGHFVPSNFSINAGHIGHFFTRPCDPSVRHCPLQCTYGFKTGTNGCQYCSCAKSNVNVTSLSGPNETTSNTASSLSTNILFAVSMATRNVSQPWTTIATTRRPLPRPTQMHSGYLDPCIPTQTLCELDCNNDYVLGPEGCQYCLCADKIPAQLRQTTITAPFIGQSLSRSNSSFVSPLSTTTLPSPSTEACVMAKVICNEKCKHGFISRPDSCLYCSCVKILSDASDDVIQTPSIRLAKPCLYTYTLCRITCPRGYIKGPRDCRFCSCDGDD